MENLDEHNLDTNSIHQETVSPTAKTFLNKASGWVKAVAILGIIGSSLGVLVGILSLFAIPIVGILYLVIYGIGIYISVLLLKVANSIDRGTFNMDKFAESFYLYWKTLVILTLVIVGLSIIAGVYFTVSEVQIMNRQF
ncbi:MAG TPA: hypothetical protein VFD77_09125 [Brumimicrobium sp.]|nr:hypothetical protein [Brumimicrobium sp.]